MKKMELYKRCESIKNEIRKIEKENNITISWQGGFDTGNYISYNSDDLSDYDYEKVRNKINELTDDLIKLSTDQEFWGNLKHYELFNVWNKSVASLSGEQNEAYLLQYFGFERGF